jgi:chromosome segregation ATPase
MIGMEEDNIETEMKGHKVSFMDRLNQASTEIDSIKSSFSKGMDDLAKIQGILSQEGVDNISAMIQDFESRLSESERRRDEAAEGAHRYSEELEKEKERLVKLWDAYKNQEEELANQEKKTTEFEDKLREIGESRGQFEEDANARIATLTQKLEEREQDVQQLEELRQNVMEFDSIKGQMEGEMESFKVDINAKEETINLLNAKIDELKKFEESAEFKTKFEEISVEFEKEKDRLTKLFRLYEETEAENRKLNEEVKEWKNWFDSNEAVFTNLFSSMDRLKKNIQTEPAHVENESVNPEMSETQPEKKQKKGRLRLRR